MGLFEQFPHTNFHELNLEWVIRTIKELSERADNLFGILEKYSLTFEGVYDSERNYDALSVVEYKGNYYISTRNVEAGITPDSTSFWMQTMLPNWDVISKLTKLNYITPDSFDGASDGEKLQKCFDSINDKAVAPIIVINRRYTLDRNITLPRTNNNYQELTVFGFGNGSYFDMKTYHFEGLGATGSGEYGGGVFFQNLFFLGSDYVFNADTIIRITAVNCRFQGFVNVVRSTTSRGYMQDFVFDKCYFNQVVSYIFDGVTGNYGGGVYNSHIKHLMRITKAGVSNFTVEGNDIEGFTQAVVNISGSCKNLSIKNNYIESNANSRVFEFGDVNTGNIEVDNNYIYLPSSGTPVIQISNYTEVWYKITNNTYDANKYLLSPLPSGTKKLTRIDFSGNTGKIDDSKNVIPLYNNLSVNEYPNTEIVLFGFMGNFNYCDFNVKVPDNMHLMKMTTKLRYYVPTSGTPVESVPQTGYTIYWLNGVLRLRVDETELKNKLKGCNVCVNVTFSYL